MNINNLGLNAFYESALKMSMTEAAKALGVTQSALSQRISTLEDELETTLFIREGKSLQLTSPGQELLNYCHQQRSLENELLAKIKTNNHELGGVLSIGTYSSIARSLVLPKLTAFLRKHPNISLDLSTHETKDLYDVLRSAKAEVIVTDFHLEKKGIKEIILGTEEYVMIESAKYKTPEYIYLDHELQDQITEDFFSKQTSAPSSYRRSFLGDIYGIIDGVEQGLGRAVVSKHLIIDNKKVKMVSGYKKYQRPIILNYFERPYYSDLFKEVIKLF